MNFRLAAASIATALLLGGAPGVLHAQRSNEPITLNFVNAEIEAVARTMAAITGRNIVVDPRVKGTMTLATDRPVSPAAAFNQFAATLRLSGFTIVESGGLWKVVPEAEAKLQGGSVTVDGRVSGSQIVTQIFRLNFETAANLVPILRPLISPNNTINVNPGNNSLVITDYADNLQRIGRIISALDVSNATDVEVINLRNALATDLAPIVQRLVESTGGATGAPGGAPQGQQADTAFRTTVIAEPRSNSLIVRAANPARLNLVRSLVARLDQPAASTPSGNIYVVYLRNADATKLAAVLRAALASMTTTSTGGGISSIPTTAGLASAPAPSTVSGLSGAGAGTGTSASTSPITPSAQPSTGGQIQADPSTNSLIITAPEPQYRQLRAVIDQLDGRRAQVMVESLIVEVNADKAAEFGIQWQNLLGSTSSSVVGVLGTNFSAGSGSGANIISLALQAAAGAPAAGAANSVALPATGFNFGVARNINGTPVLAFLARFLESNAEANVLSTPNLLTLDNEEAKIVIGQNVPFITGQFTNTGTTGSSVSPFTTVERRDVGLTLRVKPQINENGTVRLTIYQEASAVQAGTERDPNGPTTNKRTIESNVLVDDGSIVVLGGLLEDRYGGSQEKVPGLGDVPVLGNLFRSEQRRRVKSNLMVFLRPIVIRDAAQSDALSLDRYDLMRIKQQNTQPLPSALVPVEGAPLMPQAPPPAIQMDTWKPLVPPPALSAPSAP
jgi:general secretion pathway protein D